MGVSNWSIVRMGYPSDNPPTDTDSDIVLPFQQTFCCVSTPLLCMLALSIEGLVRVELFPVVGIIKATILARIGQKFAKTKLKQI